MTRASKMKLLQEVRKGSIWQCQREVRYTQNYLQIRRQEGCGKKKKKLPWRGMRGGGFSGKARAPSEQEGEGKHREETQNRKRTVMLTDCESQEMLTKLLTKRPCLSEDYE